METPETTPQASAVEANSAKPQPAAAATPPWARDRPEPLSILTATARPQRPGETVHWSIVALTVFTAMGVMIGAYGRNRSEPRELLPIVIEAR